MFCIQVMCAVSVLAPPRIRNVIDHVTNSSLWLCTPGISPIQRRTLPRGCNLCMGLLTSVKRCQQAGTAYAFVCNYTQLTVRGGEKSLSHDQWRPAFWVE
ncbi:hypothetical protein GDO78_022293 [Eleutherodactylus coqui]|uniref:Uncharacterized protein n=1 Tax=Eleutherodactylus coqui TaxID=57060 RepID=A0A8J6B8Q1_ELECQ|nr:hypothetical protein GDO78_022293 [Eleutherodactylus coqui]